MFVALTGLLCACGPGRGTTSGDDVECVITPTPLDSLDAASITGQTPAQALARAEGIYSGEVRYVGALAFHKNDGTRSPATVELVYEGGELRDIDAELTEPVDFDTLCNDSLEIDVTLRITSDDGALAESLAVTLSLTPDAPLEERRLPRIHHPYDPDAAPGGLETADLDAGDRTLTDVFIAGSFDEGGTWLTLNAEVSEGDAGGSAPFAEIFAIRELTDAACGRIPGSACDLAGCAVINARPIFADCACGDPEAFCAAAAGVGPSSGLWALADTSPEATRYAAYALDGAVEPLGPPWIPCSDLPDEPTCQCFDGANACP